jgi:hypothetical protein
MVFVDTDDEGDADGDNAAAALHNHLDLRTTKPQLNNKPYERGETGGGLLGGGFDGAPMLTGVAVVTDVITGAC